MKLRPKNSEDLTCAAVARRHAEELGYLLFQGHPTRI